MAKKSRKKAFDFKVSTRAELARIYGLSVTHIDRLIAAGAPDKCEDGFYCLKAWGRYWSENTKTGRKAGDSEDWQARSQRAKAISEEVKLQELLGKYIVREDVERLASRDFTTLRLAIGTIADRVASLVPEECVGNVYEAVQDSVSSTLNKLRVSLAKWNPASAGPLVDALEVMASRLDSIPNDVARAFSGKTRERVLMAVKMAVADLRVEMADAMGSDVVVNSVAKTKRRRRGAAKKTSV